MTKKRINKNKLLDTLYECILNSNDDSVLFSKTKNVPYIVFDSSHMEFIFCANKAKNQLEVYSYFSNKNDNFQTHTIGLNTAELLNIPRIIFELIEDVLTKNNMME